MKFLRALIGILAITGIIVAILQIPLIHFLFAFEPIGIIIQIAVIAFLAYSVGMARAGEKFSWTEEIAWSIWELLLFIFIVLTPLPIGQFIASKSSYLLLILGILVLFELLME